MIVAELIYEYHTRINPDDLTLLFYVYKTPDLGILRRFVLLRMLAGALRSRSLIY